MVKRIATAALLVTARATSRPLPTQGASQREGNSGQNIGGTDATATRITGTPYDQPSSYLIFATWTQTTLLSNHRPWGDHRPTVLETLAHMQRYVDTHPGATPCVPAWVPEPISQTREFFTWDTRGMRDVYLFCQA